MPLVMSMVVTLIYNLSDTFFVAQTNNTDLVAGVSLGTPIFTLLMAVGNIFAQGGSSLISRLLGQQEQDDVRRVSSFSFYVAIITGAVIGAFLLILVKPWYALAFTLFTALLQTADAYYIKPKIFGDTLGISGLSILIGVIVGGRMLGIIGILLAIPGVAILDIIYKDFILPRKKKKKKERDAAKAAAERQEN